MDDFIIVHHANDIMTIIIITIKYDHFTITIIIAQVAINFNIIMMSLEVIHLKFQPLYQLEQYLIPALLYLFSRKE